MFIIVFTMILIVATMIYIIFTKIGNVMKRLKYACVNGDIIPIFLYWCPVKINSRRLRGLHKDYADNTMILL